MSDLKTYRVLVTIPVSVRDHVNQYGGNLNALVRASLSAYLELNPLTWQPLADEPALMKQEAAPKKPDEPEAKPEDKWPQRYVKGLGLVEDRPGGVMRVIEPENVDTLLPTGTAEPNPNYRPPAPKPLSTVLNHDISVDDIEVEFE